MSLGTKIAVHMDHKNLTHKLSQFTVQSIMRWQLLLEEHGPTLVHKKGNENCIAHPLSQMPTKDENVTPAMSETRCIKVDNLWTECPRAMPKFDQQNCHPFQFEKMKHYQSKDNNVLNLTFINPDEFLFQMFGSHKLVCCTTGDQHLIVLTDDMLPWLVTWCHNLTAHAESVVQLEALTRHHFWHGNPRGEIWNQFSACDTCSKMKKNCPKKGQLAPCDVPSILWLEAHVDLIGSWELKSESVTAEFWAMTIVDPVTDLIEITWVTLTKSAKNARTFKNAWLAWHPKSEKVVADNGPEFNGNEWEFMLKDWGIQKGRIFSHTPAADAVVESSHHVIGQILHTTLHGTAVKTKAEVESAFDNACAIATCVGRCVSDIFSQGNAPGMVAFGQDVNINVPALVDIVAVSAN